MLSTYILIFIYKYIIYILKTSAVAEGKRGGAPMALKVRMGDPFFFILVPLLLARCAKRRGMHPPTPP